MLAPEDVPSCYYIEGLLDEEFLRKRATVNCRVVAVSDVPDGREAFFR